jgi:hypothetical protein
MSAAWEWLWLSIVVCAVAAEFTALFGHGRPFTGFWREWVTGDAHKQPGWLVWTGRIVTLAFCAWLGPHLAFGIWS